MKLAVLGGSFNPVHIGHLFLADTVLSSLDYDRIILVPAFQSPFKIGAKAPPPGDRVEMLAASIAGDPRLAIDECEIHREGVSFTIDTIVDIIARYRPDGKPGLILGDDLASSFCNWRKPDEIAELTDIIIARRLYEQGKTPAAVFPYPCKTLDNEIVNVSSQEVREKILKNANWRYLVPSGARNIIESRSLYGFSAADGEYDKGSLKAETIAVIENDVRGILEPAKFAHSRSTALLSWDLCRRFGIDAKKGYLAGIAHDMAKRFDESELLKLAHADGGSISNLERRKPSLLHARAAAVLLEKKYGIKDADILEAIRSHTTGKRDMCDLAKILYIADKIEMGRKGIDEELRNLARAGSLDTLFRTVLDNTVAYLKSHHVDISYGTKRLLSAMQKRNRL